MIINPYAFGGGAPTAYATLNPADCSADITLSGGNLTATRNGGGGAWRSVRANMSKAAGKWYFEVLKSVASGTNGSHMPGFMLGASSLSNFPGSAANSTDSGVQLVSPNVVRWRGNIGSAATGYGTVATSAYLYVAIDVTNGNAWVKGSAQGGWVLGGDPVAGTTPSFTYPAGTTIFPVIGLYDSPSAAVANFGATAFNGAVPSGFNPGWYI